MALATSPLMTGLFMVIQIAHHIIVFMRQAVDAVSGMLLQQSFELPTSGIDAFLTLGIYGLGQSYQRK